MGSTLIPRARDHDIQARILRAQITVSVRARNRIEFILILLNHDIHHAPLLPSPSLSPLPFG